MSKYSIEDYTFIREELIKFQEEIYNNHLSIYPDFSDEFIDKITKLILTEGVR